MNWLFKKRELRIKQEPVRRDSFASKYHVRMDSFASKYTVPGYPMHPYGFFEAPRSLKELYIIHAEGVIRDDSLWWNEAHNPHKALEWKSRISMALGARFGRQTNEMEDGLFAYALAECQWLAETLKAKPTHVRASHAAAVENVFMRDDMVDLMGSNILDGVRRLRQAPAVGADQEDRHPLSPQLIHLVHPNLYCYEKGKTRVLPSSGAEVVSSPPFRDFLGIEGIVEEVSTLDTPVSQNDRFNSDLRWLPSEFWVHSKKGRTNGSIHPDRCRINSYINSLHPEYHSGLYSSLGELFVLALPLLEDTLSDFCFAKSPRVRPLLVSPDNKDHTRSTYIPRFSPPKTPAKQETFQSLCDRPLQVYVKLLSLELAPGEAYDGGWWHLEGILEDRIVATACCYLESENIKGGELEFRTSIKEPSVSLENEFIYEFYGMSEGDKLVQPRGHCTTAPGRILAWPNTLEHRVRPVHLLDKNKPGHRTVCCFHLVDPTLRVRSTATVPPQQNAWLFEHVDKNLKSSIDDSFVRMKIQDNLASLGGYLTYEQACERRDRLLAERRDRARQHQDSARTFESRRFRRHGALIVD